MKRPCRFAFALISLFSNDRRLDTGFGFAPRVDAVLRIFSGKVGREIELERLPFIIGVTFCRFDVSALVTVEQIRSFVPFVAQIVLQQIELDVGRTYAEVTVEVNDSNYRRINSLTCEFCNRGSPVGNLQQKRRFFAEQQFHKILLSRFFNEFTQIGPYTRGVVCKGHFEKRRNESARRNVVTRKHPAILHKFLHCTESMCKIICITHRRHLISHLTNNLRKTASAQFESRSAAHIDVNYLGSGVSQCRVHTSRNVGYLCRRGNYHRSG